MPRQRLEPGEHGRISETVRDGRFYAATYVRDSDGKRRRVERSSDKSIEDARRILQRELGSRRAPMTGLVTEKTTLAELFETWLAAKVSEHGIKPQTVGQYRQVWAKHGAPIAGLRVTELPTSKAHKHIQGVAKKTPSQASYLRIILRDMFSMAVRFDVIPVNPITETRAAKITRKPARALTSAEFEQVRLAVKVYTAGREGIGGPKPGRLLPAFIEVLAATGARPSEVLALRWSDVDLLADPPTVMISGTLVDHQRAADRPVHRQEARKGDAPCHTVVLPLFGVEAFTALVGETGPDGPVFSNRDGGWMSLANLRRSLRAALPEHLRWVTPHSFRRTVATVVRDGHGVESAQQQLSHSQLSTTEKHYVQRHTHGPDVRGTLDRFAGG